MNVYFLRNNNKEIVKKSSSGGFFSLISTYVIKNNGIVFGATFDENFNVEITYTNSDISNMLGSKYVKSNVKSSFKDCKNFLENGKLVLYTGTPCQIYGLKTFLNKDYENLITMDVICHGSPVAEVWQNYLKSFNKKIESINFRDKREGWNQFHLTIKFEDGTEFSENHHINKYMKLFLENKILCEPCYTCDKCKNSLADFTIGDAWSIKFNNKILNDNKGTSVVLVKTEKAQTLFETLKQESIFEITNESYLNKSVGFVHNYKKPLDADKIKNSLIKPKIAIVTIPGHENIGNTLQAFALQEKIKELYPKSNPIIIDQKYKNITSFFKNKVNYTSDKFNKSFDFCLIGSDQIWTDQKFPSYYGVPFNDRFLINECNRKMVYAASFGKHILKFNNKEIEQIKNSLKTVKYISTRELSGQMVCKHYFGINWVKGVLDPTMLYDKDFYLNSIGSNPKDKKGIFVYILDINENIKNFINTVKTTLNLEILSYDKTVENFIENMNKASCVITDSYHGSVFSLIFNNPFICLRNKNRGNDRFDDLSIRFDVDNRFVEQLSVNEIELLKLKPNVNSLIQEQRIESLDFLIKGLYSL